MATRTSGAAVVEAVGAGTWGHRPDRAAGTTRRARRRLLPGDLRVAAPPIAPSDGPVGR